MPASSRHPLVAFWLGRFVFQSKVCEPAGQTTKTDQEVQKKSHSHSRVSPARTVPAVTTLA